MVEGRSLRQGLRAASAAAPWGPAGDPGTPARGFIPEPVGPECMVGGLKGRTVAAGTLLLLLLVGSAGIGGVAAESDGENADDANSTAERPVDSVGGIDGTEVGIPILFWVVLGGGALLIVVSVLRNEGEESSLVSRDPEGHLIEPETPEQHE